MIEYGYENLEACYDLCDVRNAGEECYLDCIKFYKEMASIIIQKTEYGKHGSGMK